MDQTELIRKVRAIELKTRRLVNTYFSGEYHSAFKGQGMEFSELREYQYGDDVRTIDWNVTAKTDTPFIKKFAEERELNVMLVVDTSASGSFGSSTILRKQYIIEMAAMIVFSAINNNDKVGLLMFGQDVQKIIPPAKGRKHGFLIIRELLANEFKDQGTNLNQPLEYLNHLLKRKTTLFVLSDFISDSDFGKVYKITARKHDLVPVFIRDLLEEKMPEVGLINFKDLESGKEFMVNTSNPNFQSYFREQISSKNKNLDQLFKSSKTDAINISLQKSYVEPFMHYFKKREFKR